MGDAVIMTNFGSTLSKRQVDILEHLCLADPRKRFTVGRGNDFDIPVGIAEALLETGLIKTAVNSDSETIWASPLARQLVRRGNISAA